LTKATYGRRLGEIYAFGAGTGCGKTDLLTQQIAYDIMKLNIRCGVFFLEQMPSESLRRIAGKIDGKLYHIPSSENNKWSQESLNNTVQKIVNTDNLYLYNNFGSTDWEVIQSKIRYMAHSLGVKHIYIDHLTALASHAQDERRFLDGLMEEMASLAQELNIIIHFVSHLATPQGVAHEEGGRVMAKHFRGSRSIQQWSYFMFGLERNQQATDPDERRRSLLRVLKDRHTGQSNGLVIPLSYDLSTGLLKEFDETFDSVEAFGAEPYDGEDY
jgi:twinkle protein